MKVLGLYVLKENQQPCDLNTDKTRSDEESQDPEIKNLESACLDGLGDHELFGKFWTRKESERLHTCGRLWHPGLSGVEND